jgi:hypothetical protein
MTPQDVPGVGVLPKPGDQGTIDDVTEAGNVIVALDDGRRARPASWEVDHEKTLDDRAVD